MARAAIPFALGAFLTNPNGSDAGAEAVFESNYNSLKQALGNTPTMIDVYVDGTQSVANWPGNASWQAWSNAQSPVARNMVPVLGLPMWSTAGGSPSSQQQLQDFAAGRNDAAVTGVVQSWVSHGFRTLIVRVGWEMNITGSSYAGDDAQSQANWVAAFKHIYTVLHEAAKAAGASMQVVWNPSATNYSNASATGSLYPGDAYVDIVGVDIYGGMFPFSDGSGVQYHDWVTGAEDYSFGDFVARSANRRHYWSYPAATRWSLDGSNGHSQSFLSLLAFAGAHHKPFAVPECGAGSTQDGHDVNDEGAFPAWLGATLTTAQTKGTTVAFVNIWDTNDWGNYQFSNASNNKPYERAAWKRYIGAAAAQH